MLKLVIIGSALLNSYSARCDSANAVYYLFAVKTSTDNFIDKSMSFSSR